ncbi:MAG: hypothetical protein ACK5XX_02945 [Holosporales bacterium]|jgi:hypothetical protein
MNITEQCRTVAAIIYRGRYTALYYLSIISMFGFFDAYPMIVKLPYGLGDWSPYLFLVGLWFVLRDFSQREIGSYVLLPMILGIATAYIFVNPALALASALALAVSEVVDFILYTILKKSFEVRVLISSVVASLADTAAFFFAIDSLETYGETNFFALAPIIIAALTKMLSAYFVYLVLRRNNRLYAERAAKNA